LAAEVESRRKGSRISQAPARKRKLAGAFDLSSPNFIGRMSVIDALAAFGRNYKQRINPDN
jgi:hypothetical protein